MPESLFSIWPALGFTSNPYNQETLTADQVGDELLVGRDSESEAIQRLIGTDGSFPTVEGSIGVGKSSLLEVSAYRMLKKCLASPRGELYIPAVARLQPGTDPEEFEFDVLRLVAQTLIKYANDFERAGLFRPKVDELDRWLNASMFRHREGGIVVAGYGANAGTGLEANDAEGYSRSGFPTAIRRLLAESFEGQRGGVIIILDNLELLETVGAARRTLDVLRDVVFNLPNVRWVLSGSRGIVSRARSERLSGVFQAPLVLRPLADEQAVAAIQKRIESFGGPSATAPVTPAGFVYLYKALNSNLREALATAQGFSQWLHEEFIVSGRGVPEPEERDAYLEAWLFDRAERAFTDAGRVQARNWQFFEELCAANGRAGSSDWERFGFNVQQQLVGAVTQLTEVNLMSRETDPEDGTKTVNSVTPLGWLVYFFRSRFTFPTARA
jgi:hypothetical protein